jgi:hypothetical protein
MSETSDDRPWPPTQLTIPLRKPISVGGEDVSELQLREPTAGEWEQIEAKPAHLQRTFAISLVGAVPLKEAAKLSIGDAVLAEDYLASFFEIARATPVWSRRTSRGPSDGTLSSSED